MKDILTKLFIDIIALFFPLIFIYIIPALVLSQLVMGEWPIKVVILEGKTEEALDIKTCLIFSTFFWIFILWLIKVISSF